MSARVTRKRARTDAGLNEDQPEEKPEADVTAEDAALYLPALTRDLEFWFDDGTIILESGDVQFRVYKGLLAGHSPVLKDMFAQPHGSRQVPSSDGPESVMCPYVRLSDSPQELRHVLRVFMAVGNSGLIISRDCSFDMISAYVHLGKKYQMTTLYDEAMQFLRNFYSDDFEVWDSFDGWAPPGWADIHCIGVVNLARLTGDLTILPTALLVCLAALDGDIVHGFPREDGSQENLTLDDLGLCYTAMPILREASLAAILHTFSATPPSEECKSPNVCRPRLEFALQGVAKNPFRLIRSNPLIPYNKVLTDKQLGLCRHCLKMVAENNDKERKDLWNRLPQLLGIEVPGWGVAAQQLVASG